jgi:hypothetical protein
MLRQMSRTLTTTLAFVIGVAAVGGCSVGGPPIRIPLSNSGEICLFPRDEVNGLPVLSDSAARSFAAGQPVNVVVQFPICLSSSCDTERTAACTVANSNGALQVTSQGSYLSHAGQCTTDCGLLIARCPTPALPEGTTTFKHGVTTLTLTLPFTGPPPCAGQPPS